MNSKFVKFCLLAAICTTLTFIGCKGRKSNTITFAPFQQYTSGLVVAALENYDTIYEQSCLEKNDLDYRLIKMAQGPDVVSALISGSADFATLANTPVILQGMQGKTIVIIATIMSTNKDIKLVAHKDAGINSGGDLLGKRIGFVGGTIGEIFLDRYLEKYQIPKSEVILVSAGPSGLRDNFLSKQLDAIFIWEPTIQDILNDRTIDRDQVFVDIDTTLYNMKMHLVSTPEKLQKYPDEARKLIISLICAESRMLAYPDLTRLNLEKWLDRSENTLINVFDKNSFRLELNVPILKEELQNEAIWAQKAVFENKGTIPTNYNQFIDYSILEEIAPDRVIKY